MEELRNVIGSSEKILYEGKPSKRCFILETIFNPGLAFVLLWILYLAGNLMGTFIENSNEPIVLKELIPLIILFIIILFPLWLYLASVMFLTKRYKNTYYIVTDRAIYVSSGIFSRIIKEKPFAELSFIDLHRGYFDRLLNVGDVIASSSGTTRDIKLNSITNYIEVYNLVKKLQTDIYTDVMYPNDKRPKENHGYKTEYKG